MPGPILASATGPMLFTVGYGYDWVAYGGTNPIGGSSGTVHKAIGLRSETDSKIKAADYYSLQDNSNLFFTNTYYTNNVKTEAWEQFILQNDPGHNTGRILIEYWLFGYSGACTSLPSIPQGSTWTGSSGVCVANSKMVNVPEYSITHLSNITIEAFASKGSSNMDEIQFCYWGTCNSNYQVTVTRSILNLYQHWNESEFNVFGYNNGSRAIFNPWARLQVWNALGVTPSCLGPQGTGTTGETNNLYLFTTGPAKCTVSGKMIQFNETQSFYLTMNVIHEGLGACGGVWPTLGSHWENATTNVQMIATVPQGCTFKSWAGTGLGSYSCTTSCNLSPTITMNSNITETATFYCNSNCGVVPGH